MQQCKHATALHTKPGTLCGARPARRGINSQTGIESLAPTLCDIRNKVSSTGRHEYSSREPRPSLSATTCYQIATKSPSIPLSTRPKRSIDLPARFPDLSDCYFQWIAIAYEAQIVICRPFEALVDIQRHSLLAPGNFVNDSDRRS